MMSTYGRSPVDVRAWPADPAARKALQEYLEALPQDSRDVLEALDGGDLDFSGADLTGLELSDARFGGAILSGVRLAGSDLSSAWLVQATLRGADLSRCDLHKAQARTCDAQNAIFRGARLERADFEDSDLRGADLSEVRFGRASLSGADLRGADLSGAEFGGKPGPTDLEDVRLAGCRVAGAAGRVYGPADIGADTPNLIGGSDLHDWFASRGAPLVEVTLLGS